MIVEPASAAPEILTAVAGDGDAGVVTTELGVAGGVESLVKETAAEQGDVLPAASVALAVQLEVVSVAAVTERPVAKAAAVPVATGEPEQVEPL